MRVDTLRKLDELFSKEDGRLRQILIETGINLSLDFLKHSWHVFGRHFHGSFSFSSSE